MVVTTRTGAMLSRYDYLADVQPTSGTPVFRATFESPIPLAHVPTLEVGKVVSVMFNPKSQEVELAASDPAVNRSTVMRQPVPWSTT